MGFWHTGYMEFHEPTGEWSGPRPKPAPPVYACEVCNQVFASPDDLAVHRFDGHVTTRPILTLHGRECGRSRLSVISMTLPSDWGFRNAREILINDDPVSESDAGNVLSSSRLGVVAVVLRGERADQEFEFSFNIANEDDLSAVDERLTELVRGRSLTINSIEDFLARTKLYSTARRYRDGLANYFYGVLARERSPESGLLGERNAVTTYLARFDDAVAELGRYDRPPAEAVCGLVAFHYNQFDLALRKTRSPRVARASYRLASLLAGSAPKDQLEEGLRTSLDYVLSDTENEQVLKWCCIPLDGSAQPSVEEIEAALGDMRPSDETKLRVIAAEHYLALDGRRGEGLRHVDALRHSTLTETWSTWYRDRVAEDAS